MQCPRCGMENKASHAACWSCFAQLLEGPGGKPREIVFLKSIPAESKKAETTPPNTSEAPFDLGAGDINEFVIPELADSDAK